CRSIAEEAAEMSAAHHADADEAEIDAVVGALALAFLGVSMRIENEWSRDAGGSGRGEELTPIRRGHGFAFRNWSEVVGDEVEPKVTGGRSQINDRVDFS